MPTSNENWTYNSTTHRWIPTILGCSEIDDLTQIYGDETNANRNLKSISDSVYNWAFARGHASNRAFVEYMFAFDMADIVKEAILAQVEADISSGINDLKNQHGKNVETGMQMNSFAQDTICIQAKQILMGATFIAGSAEYPIIAQYKLANPMSATRYTDGGYWIMNRVLVGAWHDAYVWRRNPNDHTFQSTNIHFRVSVMNPKDKKLSQPIQGLLMEDKSMVVKGFCQDISVKDQLEIMGKKYIITGIANDLTSPYTLGARRFNPAHIEEKVAKIITLK